MINTTTANQLLANAEFGLTLDDNTLNTLLSKTSPQLFLDALHKAASDNGAKVWLENLFSRVNLNLPAIPTPIARNAQGSAAQATGASTNKPVYQNSPTQNATVSHPAGDQQHHAPQREFKGHKVYGQKSALYVGIDETRSGSPTLRIEGAVATGPRNFNWDNKISIQLTAQELPHVVCVLFGWIQQCEYKNHGAEKNKGFKLIIQEKNGQTGLFVNIMEAGKPLCAIPVSAVDLFYLRNLALGQLQKKEPSLDTAALITSLKCLAGMLK